MEFTIDHMVMAFEAGTKIHTKLTRQEIEELLEKLRPQPVQLPPKEGTETFIEIRARLAKKATFPMSTARLAAYLDQYYIKPVSKT